MSENKNLIPEEANVPELASDVVPKLASNIVVDEELEVEEVIELTEEEKKEKEHKEFIRLLKESKIKFKPKNQVHKGKITTNQFGVSYKEKRRKKNKVAKKSRKGNRK